MSGNHPIRDCRIGGSLTDVTGARILLTRIEDWERVAAVHGEFSGGIGPANTIMQVVRFIDPDWLVQIQADGVGRTNHTRAFAKSGCMKFRPYSLG